MFRAALRLSFSGARSLARSRPQYTGKQRFCTLIMKPKIFKKVNERQGLRKHLERSLAHRLTKATPVCLIESLYL